jgi:hypothetical protein
MVFKHAISTVSAVARHSDWGEDAARQRPEAAGSRTAPDEG